MSRLPKKPDTHAAEERTGARLRGALDVDATRVDDAARARVRSAALERGARTPVRHAFPLRPLAFSLAGAAALVAMALVVFLTVQSSRPSPSTAAVIVKRTIAAMESVSLAPDDIVHDVVVETSIHYEPDAEEPKFRRQVNTNRAESWRAVGGGTERLVQHETRYDGYETSTTVILSGGRVTRITAENGGIVTDSMAAEGQMSAGHYRYVGPCQYCHAEHTRIGNDRTMRDQSKAWADGGQLYRWLLENDKLTLAGTREFDGRSAFVLHDEGTEPNDGSEPAVRYTYDIFVEASTFRPLGHVCETYVAVENGTERLQDVRTLHIESSEILPHMELPADFFRHETGTESTVRTGGLTAAEVSGFTYQPIYWLGAHPSPTTLMPTAKKVDGVEPDTVLEAIIYVASPRGSMSASDNVSAFYSVVEGAPTPAEVIPRMLAVVTRRPAVHASYLPGSLAPDPKSLRLVTRTIAGRRVTLRYRLRDGLTSGTIPMPIPDDAFVFAGRAYVEFPDAVVEIYDPSPSFAGSAGAPTESLTEADVERIVPLLERGN